VKPSETEAKPAKPETKKPAELESKPVLSKAEEKAVEELDGKQAKQVGCRFVSVCNACQTKRCTGRALMVVADLQHQPR
jgi:hypothetical protein